MFGGHSRSFGMPSGEPSAVISVARWQGMRITERRRGLGGTRIELTEERVARDHFAAVEADAARTRRRSRRSCAPGRTLSAG